MSEAASRKKRWTLYGLILVLSSLLYLLLTDSFREEEKELRTQLRESVKDAFPGQTSEFSRTIGLFHYGGNDPIGLTQSATTSIVLIHGLDDPGKVWQNLAPVLQEEGYDVWQMHYPNDQPLTESSLLFLTELKKLKQTNVDQVVVISHSMGGLVTRELLTNPDIDYIQLAGEGVVPQVTRFVMVGTPNHGSQLARFRFFAEFRDHLERLRKGEANWLGTILDGAGEAKIDLLPSSRFLTELNSRPHPLGLDSLIIAGITSPWSERDIRQQAAALADKVPVTYREDVNMLGDYLISMTRGLGDGLVTVESTRLEDIPHIQVNGTHLSMIRNISADSERVAPAIPVIVDWLKNEP